MIWQSRSRTFGPAPFAIRIPRRKFLNGTRTVPISSIEQTPIPYALRRARLTARVSATRISAPRTREETLEDRRRSQQSGGALGWEDRRLKDEPVAAESHSESTASTWIPQHLLMLDNAPRSSLILSRRSKCGPSCSRSAGTSSRIFSSFMSNRGLRKHYSRTPISSPILCNGHEGLATLFRLVP